MGYGQYILDKDGNPQLEPDLFTWAMWLEFSHLSPGKDNRIVQKDYIGKEHVSTVFLGLDHDFTRKGPPVLWETMIFGGKYDGWCCRYCTRAEALAGHAEAVELLKREERGIAELEHIMALGPGYKP